LLESSSGDFSLTGAIKYARPISNEESVGDG